MTATGGNAPRGSVSEGGDLHSGGPVPILELSHVYASYGRFKALFDISLTVLPGSVVALVGPNGAGKTTIARVCTGLVPVTAGSIVVGGTDVTGWAPWRIARLGVVHAPEGRSVFATLNVEDNLLMSFRSGSGRKEAAETLAVTYERFPKLAERRRQLAGTLSGGEQRILTLARVLARPPRMLVVDELSLGLAPKIVDEVFAALRQISEAGTAILVVEQQIPRALQLAQQVAILRKGRIVHSGPVAELGDLAESVLPTRAATEG